MRLVASIAASIGSAAIGAASLLVLNATAAAQPMHASEAAVKAAFLYNFAKFVDWPADIMAARPELRVCVLGDQKRFAEVLAQTLGDKTLQDKPVTVEPLADVPPADCEIVFIGASEAGRLHQILSDLGGRPALTVGEGPTMAQAGVMIAFTVVEGKVRFVVNPAAAERAGLQISSQLLKLAVEVVSKPAPE